MWSQNPFAIRKPIGVSYNLDEDDVLKTKSALSALGHYKKPKTGITPWADTQMFKGLKSFQKEEGLKVDGLMKPKGPTEKAIRKNKGVQVAIAPALAIPAAIPAAKAGGSAILGVLGSVLGSLLLKGDTQEDGDGCDELYNDVDIPTCRAISERRGKAAAQRCFKSASERYAACLRGTPKSQLPPLDTWNQ